MTKRFLTFYWAVATVLLLVAAAPSTVSAGHCLKGSAAGGWDGYEETTKNKNVRRQLKDKDSSPSESSVSLKPTLAPAPTKAPTLVEVEVDVDMCFSGQASVQVQGKGVVAMRDLQVGDHVLVSSAAKQQQHKTYAPVYAFGHVNPEKSAMFLQIHTTNSNSDTERPLEMTKEHLVFLQGKKHPIRADAVRVGDVLERVVGVDNHHHLKSSAAVVTKIDRVRRQGVYAPLTTSGTLVVDGILVSSYISLQKDQPEMLHLKAATGPLGGVISQHTFVHMVTSPFRVMCMGISSNLCAVSSESQQDSGGYPLYVSLGLKLNHWAHEQNAFLESVVIFLMVFLTGTFWAMETIVGSSLAPFLLVWYVMTIYKIMTRKNTARERGMKVACKSD